ncbi:MAG: C2H2-type zinc finger protein [Endozoicomonadaceae bacterium]|nr:C2H2-type zinc finger protein [Endozoicomonadaceae bacterium]
MINYTSTGIFTTTAPTPLINTAEDKTNTPSEELRSVEKTFPSENSQFSSFLPDEFQTIESYFEPIDENTTPNQLKFSFDEITNETSSGIENVSEYDQINTDKNRDSRSVSPKANLGLLPKTDDIPFWIENPEINLNLPVFMDYSDLASMAPIINFNNLTTTSSISHLEATDNAKPIDPLGTPQRIQTDEFLYKHDSRNKKSNANTQLKRHKPDTCNEHPYKCEICFKGFSDIRNCHRHEKLHNATDSYPCNICGKEFTVKRYLVDHQKIHSDEKAHKCEICGKSFHKISAYHLHEKIHITENHYICNICGGEFKLEQYLVDHQKIHSDENSYECEICGQDFKRISYLRRHEKVHDTDYSYSCDICGKKFKVKRYLNRHLKTHTDEKPHKCELCDKSFSSPKSMKRHQLTHSNSRPYK